MTETTIRRLPNGKWQLTQIHDTALSLGRTLGVLPDLGEQVAVELPKAEAWDGKWRKGDEGLTKNGEPYVITQINDELQPYPLRGAINRHGNAWTVDGRWHYDGLESGNDLTAPTKRGPIVSPAEPEPWDGVFRKGDQGLMRDGRPYLVTATDAKYQTAANGNWQEQPIQSFELPNGPYRHHNANGAFFGCEQESVNDLMPPTKRGPANAE